MYIHHQQQQWSTDCCCCWCISSWALITVIEVGQSCQSKAMYSCCAKLYSRIIMVISFEADRCIRPYVKLGLSLLGVARWGLDIPLTACDLEVTSWCCVETTSIWIQRNCATCLFSAFPAQKATKSQSAVKMKDDIANDLEWPSLSLSQRYNIDNVGNQLQRSEVTCESLFLLLYSTGRGGWVSSFLTAHQHIKAI